MKKEVPKLTHEELSRILSQAAIGKLYHNLFGSADDDACAGCGCVAGAVYALGPDGRDELLGSEDYLRAGRISRAVCGFYPDGPDAMLRYLEDRGLA